MNTALQIKKKQHEIIDHKISIKQCNEVLACAELLGVEPVDFMIISIAQENKKSGSASVNHGIAIQAISLQIKYHQECLQMLEKDLQDLINSNQF